MSERRQERRSLERKREEVPISVATVGMPQLKGQTVNVSAGGVYFTAPERLPLLVTLKGTTYRGRLVRASSTEDGMMAYAVQLVESVHEIAPPLDDHMEDSQPFDPPAAVPAG